MGTIEVFDGVTVVSNPLEPIFENDVFSLKEELSIGKKEGEKEYLFSRLSQLVINEQGDIYALDVMEGHIKVFNKHGIFLKTFGRRGQGPGEISGFPIYFALSRQDELILVDNIGISLFSLEGKFLRRILNNSFNGRVSLFVTDANSNIFVLQRSPDKHGYELNKYDPHLKFIKTIEFSISQGIKTIRRNGWNPFYPILMFKVTENGRIICARNDKYEIRIYNTDKIKLLMRIKKKYIPVRLMPKDIEEYLVGIPPQEIKSYNLPIYLPPINIFRVMKRKEFLLLHLRERTNLTFIIMMFLIGKEGI